MNLRPYQINFANNIRKSLAKSKQILACSATGSGKTKTFIWITSEAISKGRTVLIISESLKIYRQISNEVGRCYNIADGVKDMYIAPNNIYVAMAQTLAKRELIIKQFQKLGTDLLIINDEAHIGTATKLLQYFQDAYLIGFTATPDFKFAKHLPEIYKDIVIGPQPQELIEMGFLSPYYHYERKIANLSSLKKSGSDYSELSQEIAFEKKEVFDGLLDDLLKFKFKKCIVFTASIKHCKYVCEQLRAFGYQVAEVHSKNHKSDYQLFQFTHGDIKICVSVGILTKGYDFPDIDLIVLQRATISLPLYCQMIGRGSRIVDGKSHFTVLDYGGNASRLNLWNFEHDWSKKWNSAPKRKSEGVAPVKMCPKCGYMMPSVIMSCPGCGYVMEKAPPTPKETELIEVTAKYNTLRGRRIGTLTPKELAIYVKITNKKPFAKRIAMAKGQDFLEAYAKEVKWKYGWWNHIVADVSMPFTDVLIK